MPARKISAVTAIRIWVTLPFNPDLAIMAQCAPSA
jgi:hypothetical protein